jgi:hypothetical protein
MICQPLRQLSGVWYLVVAARNVVPVDLVREDLPVEFMQLLLIRVMRCVM